MFQNIDNILKGISASGAFEEKKKDKLEINKNHAGPTLTLNMGITTQVNADQQLGYTEFDKLVGFIFSYS